MDLPYNEIAKGCLWMVSVTLLGVFVTSVWIALCGDRSTVGHIISSAQVLSFIAVTVIGHHFTDRHLNFFRNRRNADQATQMSTEDQHTQDETNEQDTSA